MPRGNAWTTSETFLLKKLFADNKSLDEMVKQIGRTECAIRRKCRMLCLSFLEREKNNIKKSQPKKTLKEDERLCLRCSRAFKSEWAGNRVCGSCKRENAGYLGVVYD